MVGEVSTGGRTGRTGNVWIVVLGCALWASLCGAAAFGSTSGRIPLVAETPTPAPTATASPDIAPPPPPSRSATSGPGSTPPASQASTPAPGRTTATAGKSRPSRSTPMTPKLTNRPPAGPGAEIPYAAGPPRSPGPPTRAASPVTRLVARSANPPQEYLSGLLIYTGAGGLTVALGGLLVLGRQRRRW
jgi:hypothetical protein